MSFDKGAFLSRARQPERVEIDGFVLHFRVMTAEERVTIHDRLSAERGERKPTGSDHLNFQCALIVACAVDEHGAPLFTQEDVAQLRRQESDRLESMVAAAMRVNKMITGDGGPKADSGTSTSGASPSA